MLGVEKAETNVQLYVGGTVENGKHQLQQSKFKKDTTLNSLDLLLFQ